MTINLDLASQARSYAPIRQLSDSTLHQLRRKKAETQATRRRSDGAASIKPTYTLQSPRCTLSRLLTRNHVSHAKRSCRMYRMSPASNYCAVLTLRIILRMFPPFACLTSFISAPTLAFPATPADAFDMCSDAYAAGPRTVLRPLISDVH